MKKTLYHYNSKEFGKRLRKIRKLKGMTQARLAEELCLSEDSISNYENGKTTCMPEHITKICQIFNVSADYFFFNIEKELYSQAGDEKMDIINILNNCSEDDLSRINQMIHILLKL